MEGGKSEDCRNCAAPLPLLPFFRAVCGKETFAGESYKEERQGAAVCDREEKGGIRIPRGNQDKVKAKGHKGINVLQTMMTV